MRTLRAACLVSVLALASSLGAQRLPSFITDQPAPPPPRGLTQTPTPGPGNRARTPDGAVRISGGVMAGQIVKRVLPACGASGVPRGVVVMHAIIGTDGKIQQLTLLSGAPDVTYTTAVMNAVRQWEYKPYLLNGQAVKVDTTITFDGRTYNC